MQEIARMANVSKTTVSRVVNNKEGISDELRAKVWKIIEENDYVYNAAAASVKTSRNKTIGILANKVMGESGEDFYVNIYKEICTTLESFGYCNSLIILNDEIVDNLEVPMFLKHSKVDGIIFLGEIDYTYLKNLERYNVPFTFADFNPSNIEGNFVKTNNYMTVYDSVRKLIESGNKSIGFMGNTNLTSSILERFFGYSMALMEKGLVVNPLHIYKDRNDQGEWLEMTIDINNLPDVIICNTDKAAYDLIKTLQKANVDVPNDIEIVGFDDTLYSNISIPKITTHRVDYQFLGEEVSRLMIRSIDDENAKYVGVYIDAKYVEKESTKIIT